jgi:hypothetical protein
VQVLLTPLLASDPDAFHVDASAAFMQNAAEVVVAHDDHAFQNGNKVFFPLCRPRLFAPAFVLRVYGV